MTNGSPADNTIDQLFHWCCHTIFLLYNLVSNVRPCAWKNHFSLRSVWQKSDSYFHCAM